MVRLLLCCLALSLLIAVRPGVAEDSESVRLARVGIDYLQDGFQARGRDRLRQAVQRVRNARGARSPELAVFLLDQAEILQDRRLYEDAARLYRQALPAAIATWGDVSLEVAAAMRRLAECLRDQGRARASLSWYHEAIARYVFLFGGRAAEVAALHDEARVVEVRARSEESWIARRHAPRPSAFTRRILSNHPSGLSGVGRVSRGAVSEEKRRPVK